MTSSELRIGNYIKGIGIKPTWHIEGIKGDLIYSLDEWRLLNSFEPIPLTEDWLIRFGFGGTREYYYDTEIGAIEFYFEDEILVCDIYDSRNKNIKYVHQLQNLYFALTGEELKIK